MIQHLPNSISVFRLILVIPLFFSQTLSKPFYLLYILGGVTDIMDGFIARRFNLESDLGAKLDSLADFLFCMVLLFKVIPWVSVAPYVWLFIVLIFKMRIINIIICYFKFKEVSILHTSLNKLIGLLLFFYVFFINQPIDNYYQYLLCGIGMCSALEETLILLKREDLDLNTKSVFHL